MPREGWNPHPQGIPGCGVGGTVGSGTGWTGWPWGGFPTSAIPDLSMAVRTQHLWENSSLEQHLEASWALGCPNCPSLLRWENLGAGSWLEPPQWGWSSLDFVTETRLEGSHGRCHRASGSRRGAGNRSAPDFGKEKFLLGGTQEERWE